MMTKLPKSKQEMLILLKNLQENGEFERAHREIEDYNEFRKNRIINES